MLFTNYTLVFCEASQAQMVHLTWLLMWFEAKLGLFFILIMLILNQIHLFRFLSFLFFLILYHIVVLSKL